MAINTTTRQTTAFTSGQTFAFAFKVYEVGDVKVIRITNSTGAEEVLTITTHYTVTLNDDQNANPGGSITLVSSGSPVNLGSGFSIVITSKVTPLQQTEITNQGGFFPEVINDVLDKAAILDQQQQSILDKTIRFPLTQTVGGLEITENAANRANKTLVFDGSGDLSVSATVDGRDVSADGAKLDTIETNAKDDQTAAEIRALVESASDSNVFTDQDHSKLNGIEAGATGDQTASEIKSLYESNSNTNAFTDALVNKLNGIEAGATGDQSASEIRTLVGSASDSNVFTDNDHSKLDGIEANATADQTASEIRGLVESASDSNVFTDADHSKLNAIEPNATQDQTASEIKTLLQSDKLTASEIATGALDGRYYTEAESDARYFNISTGDTIKDGDTFPDNDTTIATTAAINDRIIDLVDDVGGFVPIANETSFPTANPDAENGTGTIVSVKAASTNLTPSGTTVTIANGAGTGNTVTITGVPSVIPSGFGFLVETTTTLHTYTFHRLVPKATEVTTVAGKATQIQTVYDNINDVQTVANSTNLANITAVAADASDIGAVAGKATEIGRLGTADAVADMALLGTTDVVADMNMLATTDVIADMNMLATSDVIADMALLAVADVISDMNALATSDNITAMDTCRDNISSITNASNNISSVNNFGDKYQIASSDPSTDGGGNALAVGDLYFNTSANELKVYNGSAWQGGVTASGNFASITGNTFTGSNRYNNNRAAIFGTSTNSHAFSIKHDGNNGLINNGTGTLFHMGGNHRWVNNGVSQNIAWFQEDGFVKLYYDGGTETLATTANGINVYGTVHTFLSSSGNCDLRVIRSGGCSLTIQSQTNKSRLTTGASNHTLELGTNGSGRILIDDTTVDLPQNNQRLRIGSGQNLQFYHNGTDTVIQNDTGDVYFLNNSTNSDDIFIKAKDDIELFVNTNELGIVARGEGSAHLYYDGGSSPKLSTVSDGVDVTGHLECTGTLICGQLNSGTQIVAGNPTLRFRTTNNSLANKGTIEFYYNTSNLAARIRGKSRNGSNGQIYFDVEASSTMTNIVYIHDVGLDMSHGNLNIPNDTYKLRLGESADLQLFHTGSYSNIYNSTGDLDISSDVIRLKRGNRSETFASFIVDGQAEFHYDGGSTPKLQTYSGGINVTGRVVTDALSVTVVTDYSTNNGIFFYAGDTGAGNRPTISLKGAGDQGTTNKALEVFHNNGSTRVFDVDYGGNIFGLLDLTIRHINATGNIGIPSTKYFQAGDNDEISLGFNNNGLLLYGSNTFFASGNVFRVANAGISENIIWAKSGAEVELYYDGGSAPKIETYSSGILVRGVLNFDGDTDTFIDRPNSNQIEITCANKEIATFIDGSNNRPAMLIDKGQANNTAGGANYNSNPNANDLVVGNVASGNHGITICTPNDAVGTLNFSDGSGAGQDAYRGSVSYNHTDEKTVVRAKSGSVALRRDATDILLAAANGITITGNILPEANGTRDLGSNSLRWANVYTNDLNLSNEGGKNDVDGTWGSYTIQEGEEDLFLINKRSGKKYKFALTEVS